DRVRMDIIPVETRAAKDRSSDPARQFQRPQPEPLRIDQHHSVQVVALEQLGEPRGSVTVELLRLPQGSLLHLVVQRMYAEAVVQCSQRRPVTLPPAAAQTNNTYSQWMGHSSVVSGQWSVVSCQLSVVDSLKPVAKEFGSLYSMRRSLPSFFQQLTTDN